ncbi:DUF6265 family protein [Chitinophaga vietnamensis]|uniref:DUF6265 family protein n=1 Tax=Chitinophaga vietnamensis TaxID=2593957 RepID=UPI001177E5DD|nr:DUF6265 family protein [Chitinophaga vietnamensis]
MAKKQWWNSSILFFLLIACSSLQAAAQARTADFNYLDRLEGTWKMETKRSTVVETWTRVNDSTWHGRTWRVVGADSALQQSIQLVRHYDGIYFIPAYTGRETFAPIRLKLRVLKPVGFVAEDLQNDFPQKITYRFVSGSQLDARVQGKRDGTIEEYIFHYTADKK